MASIPAHGVLSELYKSQYRHLKEEKQSARRSKLLAEQRLRRTGAVDEERCFEEAQKIVRCKLARTKQPRCNIELQKSEWFCDIPSATSEWFVKPCPKGVRALIIAAAGKTLAYNENGDFIRSFRSGLPGDRHNQRKATTILDCMFVPRLDTYFVMDAISYGTQDLSGCEAEFRSFWIESRFDETDVSEVTKFNEFAFQLVRRYECCSSDELNTLATEYPPIFNTHLASERKTAEVAGYLFYHKESLYTHGKTPLVGWILPFMLPELFCLLPFANDEYSIDRTANYANIDSYIDQFGSDRFSILCKRKNNCENKMDAENCERNEADGVADDYDMD